MPSLWRRFRVFPFFTLCAVVSVGPSCSDEATSPSEPAGAQTVEVSEDSARVQHFRYAGLPRTYDNVVLISWDGVQKQHLQALLKRGKLPTLRDLAARGSMSEVYSPPLLRVTEAGVEPVSDDMISPADTIYWEASSTDPGHARMLTGTWNHLNRMCREVLQDSENVLGIDYLCKNGYTVVKAGNTLFEKVRKIDKKHRFLLGAAVGRHSYNKDMTSAYGTGYGKFVGPDGGEVYILADKGASEIASHGFFSHTLANALPSLDFFFDSEKVSLYGPDDVHQKNYRNDGQFLWGAEIKDHVVARMANTFIAQAVRRHKRFFLFVHFVEPDLFGHAYGENSQEYSQALRSNDRATGLIYQQLQELGIGPATLVMVTTDHGAREDSPAARIKEKDGRQVLMKLGGLHGQTDQENHAVWMVNDKYAWTEKILQPQVAQRVVDALGLPLRLWTPVSRWDPEREHYEVRTGLGSLRTK